QLLTITGFSPNFLSKRPPHVVRRMVQDTLASLPQGIGRQSELDQRIDITADLAEIKASTLVIGCRDDQMVPVQHARGLVAPIRWSDYTELESGHLALFEQPAALTQAVAGFLDRPERRAGRQPFEGDDRRE
ncbi:MAG: hypothetical protein Q7T55_17265, partial [Solirubrobacteraceae bacterium]|nr:hypothetical protein [Solirubrobacteraceae bacterium]